MSEQGGGNDPNGQELWSNGQPDWDALDKVAGWELRGAIILLVVAVLMAAAANFYGH